MMTGAYKNLGFTRFLMGAILFATLPLANANVSIKNGNFYTGNKDAAYPGGLEPKIERVLNSKSPYKGNYCNC